MIVIPAGIYHRFTLDTNVTTILIKKLIIFSWLRKILLSFQNFIKAKRFFIGEPVWLPYNRPSDTMECRKSYLEKLEQGFSSVEAWCWHKLLIVNVNFYKSHSEKVGNKPDRWILLEPSLFALPPPHRVDSTLVAVLKKIFSEKNVLALKIVRLCDSDSLIICLAITYRRFRPKFKREIKARNHCNYETEQINQQHPKIYCWDGRKVLILRRGSLGLLKKFKGFLRVKFHQ